MLGYHRQFRDAGFKSLLGRGGDEVEDVLRRRLQPLLLADAGHLLMQEPVLKEGGVPGRPEDGAHVLRAELPGLVREIDSSHGGDIIDVIIRGQRASGLFDY